MQLRIWSAILLTLVSTTALATGDRRGSDTTTNNLISNSSSHVSVSPSQRVQNHVSQTQTSSSVVESGAATSSSLAKGGEATGGSATVGDVTGGSAEGGSVGDVSVNTRGRRQAPGVALAVPQSTMECAKGVGFGGSNTSGSVLVGWSWLQRDCWALHQFYQLASLGLSEPAANAYCSRRMHWQPFESEANCRSLVALSLENRSEEVAADLGKPGMWSISPLPKLISELPK